MSISGINSVSYSPISFAKKSNVQQAPQVTSSKTKKVVKTAVTLAALTAVVAAGVHMVKSGKVDFTKIKNVAKEGAAKVFKPKSKPFVSQGGVKGNFTSSADMGNAIVEAFQKMQNRLRAHHLFQHKYNTMNWEQAIVSRSSIIR